VKFLLMLLVVVVALWMLSSRLRGPGAGSAKPGAKGRKPPAAEPVVMVQCAHCGLHLASADALPEGSRLYCSDAHRRLGPGPSPNPPPNPPQSPPPNPPPNSEP